MAQCAKGHLLATGSLWSASSGCQGKTERKARKSYSLYNQRDTTLRRIDYGKQEKPEKNPLIKGNLRGGPAAKVELDNFGCLRSVEDPARP